MPRLGELRQNDVQLAETDQRLAADDRDVNRVFFVDDRQDAIDQFLSLEIGDLAQRDVTAEVLVAVGVTAGAAKRAFPRDLDRQGGPIASEDLSPRGDDAFHPAILHDRPTLS